MNPIRNSNFQILNSRNSMPNNRNRQENNRYEEEEEDSFILLKSLNESLNKDLSQSVFDLVKCFICYNQVENPLSCPKCNNFACKKCLEMYFGNQRGKKCPICKQNIEIKSLKKNELISKLEDILNKCESEKNKIEELSALIEEKKSLWENQANNINGILNRIFKYQENLEEYKKEYQLFFLNCQKVIDKTFEDYLKKTEELVKSLLSFNKMANESVIICDKISKKNRKDDYNEKNIRDMINEIMNLERKHFNDKNHEETEKFLNSPIKILPLINQFHIKDMRITKNDIIKFKKITKKGIHYKIGDFLISYSFNIEDGYKAICEFSFTINNNMNACFFVTQNKICQNGEQNVYPMKLTKKENNNFVYECFLTLEELDINNQNYFNIKTDVLAFYI